MTVYTVRKVGTTPTFKTNDISNLPEGTEIVSVEEMSEVDYFSIPATNASYEFFSQKV